VLSAYAQARQQLAILPGLGRNTALHATASGKAWLASLSEEEAIEIALRHGLEARTEHTVTRVSDLLAELELVETNGYAIAEGEFTSQVNSIAFPIGADRFGAVVAAVAVSAPASRMDRDRMAEIAPAVKQTAADLEAIWPIGVMRTDSMRREDLSPAPEPD
jgi:DNA-binding IclR family transcriptional regulator